MPISAELLQAKQLLSGRLLQTTVRSNGVGLKPFTTMAGAAAAAGRNVHAVGIGKKVVNGKDTDELCIRIYVIQKIAPSAMAPRDLLPSQVNGIPTDIIEAPMAFAAARRRSVRSRIISTVRPTVTAAAAADDGTACTDSRRQRQRPFVAGISTGHPDVTAGTIGYFCSSIRAGDDPAVVYILSNNHIFANLNRGSEGDPLYQPGSIDGGAPADTIATLKRWVDLELDGSTPNLIDGAIGQVSGGVQYSIECCCIGVIAGTAQASGGMAVRKHGRTSGYTEGTVSDEFIDALVGMDENDPSVIALFQNQMRLVPTAPYPAIGLGGDSGSLVVDSGIQNAVGLYFANPPSGAYGYANHIADVLSNLEISLL
jgi:hypothetical protein